MTTVLTTKPKPSGWAASKKKTARFACLVQLFSGRRETRYYLDQSAACAAKKAENRSDVDKVLTVQIDQHPTASI